MLPSTLSLLLLNPSVGFAVNDRVTLSTGVQWTRRAADRIDGQSQGIDRTATNLSWGSTEAYFCCKQRECIMKLKQSGIKLVLILAATGLP